jgi:hypothetical protein
VREIENLMFLSKKHRLELPVFKCWIFRPI